MKAFISICALAAAAFANPFGLDFGEAENDSSFGHHGKPAKYKAMESIVHPWKESGDNAHQALWFDGLKDLLEEVGREMEVSSELELARSLDMEMGEMGMMDPFGEMSKIKRPEMDQDEMAMRVIMQSTPEMCPLCAKEGHALGHEDHKRVLAKLRERVMGKGKCVQRMHLKEQEMESDLDIMMSCEMCMSEGSTRHHKEHMMEKEQAAGPCPLCRAEGNNRNHVEHLDLMKLATAMDFVPTKDNNEMNKKSTKTPKGLKLMMDMLDMHRDMVIASKAEAQLTRDRRQRVPTEKLAFEFIFSDSDDIFGEGMDSDDSIMTDSFDMMKMKRSDPVRDFHRRLGEPADELEDEPAEDESVWEKIIRNIRDLLGMGGEAPAMKYGSGADDNDDEENGMKDLAGIVAMLLLLFVGLLLVSFGAVEFLAVIFGEGDSSAGYQVLSYDAEERMILQMEDGGHKGGIAI